MTPKKTNSREFLDKRVFTRLRILTIISIVLFAATVYEVVINGFNIIYAVTSIILGVGVGIIVSRMYHLSWDEETNQVVSNMDWIGAIIFILYIIFIITRTIVVGYWTDGTTYMGIIVSITAGVMFGRMSGTKHTLTRIKNDLESVKKSLVN
ncbi:hypothetical protein [Methanobacterium petrolearium]|uniref:hypothetical protein n=1 Tax=Methanobacterium petrolearium TaxID=710190 RepID=UPI001AE92667|nr:hypothetical protein [Methanobacterium petrolearium]MBP1946304.1 hypothetical protein [Methanobacterium petrolearium]BDZ71402.1 hypothetical protein GCM10025861_19190 [Methanobacterium petrolearium]